MTTITKSDHAQYLASEWWLQRRKPFLQDNPFCNRCRMPRFLAVAAYGQDLHVHHKNYQRIGAELDSDLEPLCRYCHEMETFGSSKLPFPVLIVGPIAEKFLAPKSEEYMEGLNDAIEWILYLMRYKGFQV